MIPTTRFDQPIDQPIESIPLVFFDLETTGLPVANGHRVCEIALIRVRGNTIERRFSSLVNPQRPIDDEAFSVNHITPSMMHNAPDFGTIVHHVVDIIHDSVLIAHNAPFDMAFLAHEFRLLCMHTLTNPVFDTLNLARRLLTASSYSLNSLSHMFGLEQPTHRAMDDVVSLYGLFQHLQPLLAQCNVITLADVLRYQRGLLPGDPEPDAPPLIAHALREEKALRIVYRSRSTPTAHERIIHPRELHITRGELFVHAYCCLRQEMRLFAVKKIEEMHIDN